MERGIGVDGKGHWMKKEKEKNREPRQKGGDETITMERSEEKRVGELAVGEERMGGGKGNEEMATFKGSLVS